MRHRMLVVALLAMASVTAACAHGGAKSTQRDPNLITQDEIARITATNAYDAVQMLRPSFLRQRGVPSTTSGMPDLAIVYLDGMKMGDVGQLQRIPTVGIVSIRYINAIEANQRYGRGHEGGAILVDTRQ
jgi:hypothetical protein